MRIGGDVAAVLREIGQEEQRASIKIASDGDQRYIRARARLFEKARRQRDMSLAAHRPATEPAVINALVHVPPFLFAAEQPYL
jgi:hypothetical protein